MSLTLEDGTGVAAANSYVSAADLTTYAANNGLTLPATDAEKEALLRQAFTQMNGLQWRGRRTYSTQRGAWPRYGVTRDGFDISSITIPAEITDGQMAYACEIYDDQQNPVEARTGAQKRVKVEGAVEVEYAEASVALTNQIQMRQSMAHFADFILGSGQVRMIRA